MTILKTDKNSFFSVGFSLIITGETLPYDLFVNSSGLEGTNRFVRIFPNGETLHKTDVENFKIKYTQLYVPEYQRPLYLKSLVKNKTVTDTEKVEVIKDIAINYLNHLFDEKKEFNTEILEEALIGSKEAVEAMVDVLNDYKISDMQRLIGSLSFHDFYTFDHSINVAMYTMAFFKDYKKNAQRHELVLAGLCGLLHDLGKINIPTHVLNNPDKLSDEEFQLIKLHPVYGKKMLEENPPKDNQGIDLDVIKRAVSEHHENVDGSGYPMKLKGNDIHLLSRMVAITDFFDAITTKRSYSQSMKISEALAIMEKTVGKKIDKELFTLFEKTISLIEAKKANLMLELPMDLDFGQPHRVLPFKKIEPKKQKFNSEKESAQNIGKKEKKAS